MERLIFPMRAIGISNTYTSSHPAWDLVGSDTDIDYWYAPCTVKVLATNTTSPDSHTVHFGTCDKDGHAANVMCADGVERILTFACTHMNSLNNFDLHVGKIFPAGAPCYMEGTSGLANGNHVHMEVGTGWQYTKNANAQLNFLISPANLFYRLSGWNIVSNNYGTNGYSFPITSSRYTSDPSYKYYLKTTNDSVFVRTSPVYGSIKATIPVSSSAEIISFIPGFQDNGYQWAFVKYNSMYGFSQIDTYNYYTVSCTANALTYRPLYVINKFSNLTPNIRSSIISGSVLGTIPVNTMTKVTVLLSGFQADGYQWGRVLVNGVNGYAQLDVNNYLYFTEVAV